MGTCTSTIVIKDAVTERWKQYDVHFFVIKSPSPLMILGTPFLRQHRASIDYPSLSVSLKHGSDLVEMKVSLGHSPKDTINSILDCSHPLAFTMENYTIHAGAGLGIKMQIPDIFEQHDVEFVPLPDTATEFFDNKRGLRLHGPVVAT